MTRHSSKRWAVGLALLVAAAVLALGWRPLMARLKAPAAAPAPAGLSLASADWETVRDISLTQDLPFSGSLRARDAAWLKARAAGELRELRVREGDAVKAGQVVARIEASELNARLRQAQDQAASALAQVSIAQRQFDNNQALVNQGFISRTALDTSQANLDAAKANHQAALAAVDVARKALDDTLVRSPISGLVSQRLAQAGERVGLDARIVEVLDLRTLELEAQFSPAQAAGLQIGQRAQVTVQDMEPRNARVARIRPAASEGTRTVPVYLQLDDAKGLRHGVFAQGRIEAGQVRGLALPLEAIRTDQPQPYVQVLEGERLRHRPVTLGAQGLFEGRLMVMVNGLPTGARVTSGSVGSVRDGTTIMQAP
jgi:multidrug efflux system membrane fusion protein